MNSLKYLLILLFVIYLGSIDCVRKKKEVAGSSNAPAEGEPQPAETQSAEPKKKGKKKATNEKDKEKKKGKAKETAIDEPKGPKEDTAITEGQFLDLNPDERTANLILRNYADFTFTLNEKDGIQPAGLRQELIKNVPKKLEKGIDNEKGYNEYIFTFDSNVLKQPQPDKSPTKIIIQYKMDKNTRDDGEVTLTLRIAYTSDKIYVSWRTSYYKTNPKFAVHPPELEEEEIDADKKQNYRLIPTENNTPQDNTADTTMAEGIDEATMTESNVENIKKIYREKNAIDIKKIVLKPPTAEEIEAMNAEDDLEDEEDEEAEDGEDNVRMYDDEEDGEEYAGYENYEEPSSSTAQGAGTSGSASQQAFQFPEVQQSQSMVEPTMPVFGQQHSYTDLLTTGLNLNVDLNTGLPETPVNTNIESQPLTGNPNIGSYYQAMNAPTPEQQTNVEPGSPLSINDFPQLSPLDPHYPMSSPFYSPQRAFIPNSPQSSIGSPLGWGNFDPGLWNNEQLQSPQQNPGYSLNPPTPSSSQTAAGSSKQRKRKTPTPPQSPTTTTGSIQQTNRRRRGAATPPQSPSQNPAIDAADTASSAQPPADSENRD